MPDIVKDEEYYCPCGKMRKVKFVQAPGANKINVFKVLWGEWGLQDKAIFPGQILWYNSDGDVGICGTQEFERWLDGKWCQRHTI